MKVGDLVKNKSTGQLSVVIGVGKAESTTWITLYDAPRVTRYLGASTETVYHAEYFEVVSPTKEQEDDN